MPDLFPRQDFDYVGFEADLRKHFEVELDRALPAGTGSLTREKIITAHDKAIVHALIKAAPAGVVT